MKTMRNSETVKRAGPTSQLVGGLSPTIEGVVVILKSGVAHLTAGARGGFVARPVEERLEAVRQGATSEAGLATSPHRRK
jgi:hypothetical protein